MGLLPARLAGVPGQPCPPAASSTKTVSAPVSLAACVVVVTVPCTAVVAVAAERFALTQKSTTSRTGLYGVACAARTSALRLMPPSSGTSSSFAPLMISAGTGTEGTVSKVNMVATTGAMPARRCGRAVA